MLSSALVYQRPWEPGLIENTGRVDNTSMNQIKVLHSEVYVDTVDTIDEIDPPGMNTVARILALESGKNRSDNNRNGINK